VVCNALLYRWPVFQRELELICRGHVLASGEPDRAQATFAVFRDLDWPGPDVPITVERDQPQSGNSVHPHDVLGAEVDLRDGWMSREHDAFAFPGQEFAES
jgi:hypothetical protein